MVTNGLTISLQKVSAVSAEALGLLLDAAEVKALKKGQYLLREGQVCRVIWYIEKGYLRTFYNKDGQEINTRFSFEHSFVTDLKSLRSETPANYSILTGEDATVWAFEKEKLLRLYRQSVEIESFGRNLLEQMLIEQEEHGNLFKLYSPAERYQYMIQHQPRLLQRVSLGQLASYLGIARETLSRIRKNR
ncbi:Crp/Fnr family transcriptional regulator [Larkinella harenae]